MVNKELNWLLSHPEIESKHIGEYVAIAKDAVVAHGKDFKEVLEKAEKIGKESFIHKVPPFDRELVV
ncbi:MAG: hypothetical protein CHKLHMKO_00639 [Candidatus Argoarchaeum ethanivorans]|uniref:DUF5678 domain-containing protein n=1 Tax=Candidatus Argoarchaeum ethanivorans TaxID=2608793 RepID=A0A811TEA1_9EURY|nr:MAG: hypothetical protein CHKLHMKO_00639 [Candidatus Argoarchaeum ethanivorans]